MDIQYNYLTKPVPSYHPDNTLWNPQDNPDQLTLLEPFLTTPSNMVGIGIAITKNEYDISELQTENHIPVRLSTFSTAFVSVDYSISTHMGVIEGGTLNFIPGQTVQIIHFTRPLLEDLRWSEFH
jgi:hypothetical protein